MCPLGKVEQGTWGSGGGERPVGKGEGEGLDLQREVGQEPQLLPQPTLCSDGDL